VSRLCAPTESTRYCVELDRDALPTVRRSSTYPSLGSSFSLRTSQTEAKFGTETGTFRGAFPFCLKLYGGSHPGRGDAGERRAGRLWAIGFRSYDQGDQHLSGGERFFVCYNRGAKSEMIRYTSEEMIRHTSDLIISKSR
jgi:hypothetical protein